MNEIKNLPKGWSLTKISNLIGNDGVFCDGDWIESKDQDLNGEVRLIQLADVGDGYFRDRSNRCLTLNRAIELNCTFLNYGDILVARMPDPLGRACLFPLRGKNKYVTVVDVAIIRSDETVCDQKFLCYSINSPQIRNEINNLESGTTRKRISRKNLNTIDFPLPPLPEQQAIVSKIEALFSKLDNGIQQLRTAQAQLKVYRQSLLKWAFEGKLTNKEVKEGELPEGWKWGKLGEVSEVSGGLTKNAQRQSLELQLPFLRVANVYFNNLDLTEMHNVGIKEAEIKRVLLKKDDLLFVEGNGSIDQIGRVALWNGSIENCVHQNHLIKSRLSNKIIPKFALYFFCSISGRNKIKEQANSTSGLHTLNLSKISKLELPLPPIEQQHLIVTELESKLTICDKIEETIQQSLQQAETLRQSILKQAFEGKLINMK